MTLRIRPITLKAANAFVALHHRHHPPARGCRFCLCVVDSVDAVRGVVIVGRPVSREIEQETTAEVTRLCTDGTRNACSMLYGAAKRAAAAMGFTRVITYTLPEEGGASLRGAGWKQVGITRGGSWNRAARARGDHAPIGQKVRWEA